MIAIRLLSDLRINCIFEPVMNYRSLLSCVVLILLFCSCRKENLFTDDPAATLRFSTDTLWFDTVFVTQGSITRRIQIFNDNKKSVRIADIQLGGGTASPYMLNIDGVPTTRVQQFELAGKDSAYIFVKVKIDPTAATLPFVVQDSILFQTNGNRQKVQLAAYGQNAHFLRDSIIDLSQHWTNDLPYVIIGDGVLVDTGITLTIDKGARLYFHRDAQLFVKGTLKVNGVLGDSVTFQSDRLEKDYFDEPGQWNSIQFLSPSRNNLINYAVIKNAVFGVIAGTLPADPNINVTIQNSVIKHMTVTGIFGINAKVKCYNNLIFDCGQYAFFGAYGGDYEIKHSTIGNFTQGNFSRSTPSVLMTDFLQDNTSNPLEVTIQNSIIWGNLDDEFALAYKGTQTPIVFENNLLRTELKNLPSSNISNKDPLFVQPSKENFHLKDNTSAAYRKGAALPGVVFANDLDGKARPNPPSIGCYELLP